jgi:hypothetical protein
MLLFDIDRVGVLQQADHDVGHLPVPVDRVMAAVPGGVVLCHCHGLARSWVC